MSFLKKNAALMALILLYGIPFMDDDALARIGYLRVIIDATARAIGTIISPISWVLIVAGILMGEFISRQIKGGQKEIYMGGFMAMMLFIPRIYLDYKFGYYQSGLAAFIMWVLCGIVGALISSQIIRILQTFNMSPKLDTPPYKMFSTEYGWLPVDKFFWTSLLVIPIGIELFIRL